VTLVDRPNAAIRTFHPRRGRLSDRHFDALERLAPRYGIYGGMDAGMIEVDVVEIGSGMGDATAEMARADPGRTYLAVEIHTPGVANLLALIERGGITNLRVASVDAVELLRYQIRPGSLAAIHVFFPDPWPKAKHHKRRLVRPAHVALLRDRLRPGGVLHCATDHAGYAAAMLETLSADPGLVNRFDGYAPRPAHRPLTKFEQRGLAAGRPVADLIFTRADAAARREVTV
jgi:tRNA (guanine-N7-)-methyltransferase